MKYSYEIDLNDMLIYQEQLFLSRLSPSIKDSVKRWEKIVFLALIVLIPAVLFLTFNNLVICFASIIIDSMIYLLFKQNSTLYFWKNYKSKARKDLLATYFNNNENNTIAYTLKITTDQLEIESDFGKKKIKIDEIIQKRMTDNYIFFYTKKHDASYIPLEKITSGKEAMVDWFSLVK